jgi:hypothetical protein
MRKETCHFPLPFSAVSATAEAGLIFLFVVRKFQRFPLGKSLKRNSPRRGITPPPRGRIVSVCFLVMSLGLLSF